MTFLLLFAIIATVLSAPIQPPTPFASFKANVLGVARTSAVSCVVNQFLVIAGGLTDPTTPTDYIEVVDLTTVTVVATGNLSVGRVAYGIARLGNNCVVVGGANGVSSTYDNVDVIAVDPTSGAITVTAGAAYPAAVANAQCASDPTASDRIYCFGGATDVSSPPYILTSAAYRFDGTNWTTLTNLPVPFQWFNDVTYTTTFFDNRAWICGGADDSTSTYPSYCQVYDPATDSYVNVSTTYERGGGVLQVVEYPTPALVWFGGYNWTDSLPLLETFTGSAGVYTVSVGTSSALFGDSGAGVAYGSSLYAFGGHYYQGSTNNILPTLFSAYVWNPAAAVDGPYAVVTSPATVLTGGAPGFEGTTGGAYGPAQKVVFCGGMDGSNTLNSCFIFDFSCLGNSSTGSDGWVSNATYVGCDKINCLPGFYGPHCTPCNCNGQPCRDGFHGSGQCICATGLYGSTCGSTQLCSGNGIPFDGANGNGSCFCFPGYGGVDCSTSATCGNGVFDQASGNCVCRPGFFGSSCTGVCACGGNGQCNDGSLGDGTCYCASGFYGATCSGVCNCLNGGLCNEGPSGDGTCGCVTGYYGADCGGDCACQPVVVTPTEIKIFRCNDGSSGDGTCIRLNSGSSLSTFLALVVLCLSVIFF